MAINFPLAEFVLIYFTSAYLYFSCLFQGQCVYIAVGCESALHAEQSVSSVSWYLELHVLFNLEIISFYLVS